MSKKPVTPLTLVWRYIEYHNWHQHPFFIPVVTFLVLFFVSLFGFVLMNGREVSASDSYVVILSHDKKRETVPTRAVTVGDFLDRVGVQLHEGDVVEPDRTTPIAEDNFRVNVYRARPVMVQDGGQKTFAFSAATTPRSVAGQAGVTVHPEDKIKSEMPTNFLKEGAIGETIVIDRATPTNLNLYGTPVPVRTHAKTVGELLEEKKIQLAKDDTLQPAAETKLTPQLQIFVVRSGSRVETREIAIPMQTQTIEDASLSFGATAVRQQGAAGKKVVTYQIDLKNGKEVSRKIIQEVVAQEPVTHIVARGKTINIPADKEAVMAAAGIARSDYGYANYIISRESGWNAAARNKRSGAFGLCQALPGTKMASAGADWQTNPVTQLKWCSGYAKGRYGSWSAAYNFWLSHHYW
jgi:resuscitation-promoting factor RpfB